MNRVENNSCQDDNLLTKEVINVFIENSRTLIKNDDGKYASLLEGSIKVLETSYNKDVFATSLNFAYIYLSRINAKLARHYEYLGMCCSLSLLVRDDDLVNKFDTLATQWDSNS